MSTEIDRAAFLVTLTRREEVLLATSVLEETPIPSRYFPAKFRSRCEEATDALRQLPLPWAIELCREVLQRAEKELEPWK